MNTYLTAEQIWKAANERTDTALAERRAINKAFRAQDDSGLWPINGRCNVTERAIRKARWFEHETGVAMDGFEYALFLEDEMGRIVNDERNW